MEIQGLDRCFRRRSQEIEDVPGEDHARSRRSFQRQEVLVSAISPGMRRLCLGQHELTMNPVCGNLHAKRRCAQSAETDRCSFRCFECKGMK